MKKHNLIIVCGLVGTGKTTVANYIASKIRGVVLSTDAERGRLIHKKKYFSFDGRRKKAFEREEKDIVYNALFIATRHLLNYTNVILDGTFDLNRYFDRARDIAKKKKARFGVIECILENSIARQRIADRFKSKKGYSVANLNIYEVVKKRYQKINFDHYKLDTSGDWRKGLDNWIKKILNGNK